jgi:precorrin-2 dehydrogenase/sirohydrochlorin ferrochelatase
MPAAVPLAVRLDGRRVVCVGAGPVAARKLASLAGSGAQVVVVAPGAVAAIADGAAARALVWHRRAYRTGDLDGAFLALAGTADAEVNARVAADADAAGTLCVRVDGGGSADLAAAVRRGPLLLAVSTDAASPALARRVRADLEERYGEEYGALATLLAELRTDPHVVASLADRPAEQRAALWRRLTDADILALVRTGQLHRAREVALACLSSSSD